ncbi:hypothetical protein N7474_006917 [Penicillium riverlandense]|uniref:uncharacterized protein n=1 Tax=Penicillium riverlandense TaxID=1903569 RepID=UPI00254800C5|nr:uncharacterized protein N7474_006917 [Penicillium riverlandense]KAJ5815140.1 hypothetical protein N7474_006917 [Penicillium riverlandense]
MDQQPSPVPAQPSQLPPSTPDPGESILDMDASDSWFAEQSNLNWSSLNDFYFCSSRLADTEGSQWEDPALPPAPSSTMTPPNRMDVQTQQLQHTASSPLLVDPINTRALGNVSQWLDGAYRPSVPCSHCRRHRLQCLILRTAPANPNPIKACSSCVALFRECSLAKGEKRLPSGFETFSPVLGHLHGVPEHTEDGGIKQEQPINQTEPPTERKESKQFIRKGARVLREWFSQNQTYPYPSEAEKDRLSRETGFSTKRISTWFANARRRQKQKLQTSTVHPDSHFRAGSPMVTSTLSSMLTPMERWQVSPPEDEPVPKSVIQDAIASESMEAPLDIMDAFLDPFSIDGSAMDLFNFEDSSSHLPSSASSFGSRASETSASDSASSAWSYQSSGGEGSFLPFPLIPKRNTTRRQRHTRRGSTSNDVHQYQCTFCTQSFRKRHDWTRHEKSVHLPLDSWICTPSVDDMNRRLKAETGSQSEPSSCPFCELPSPTPSHLEEHEFAVCAEKPITERSFSRKDYLWQHLRKFHGCTKTPVPDLDAWRSSGSVVHSRCGFCERALPSWRARAEHLSEHFRNGARMEQWAGDWGLDAMAMGVLRNVVLPAQRGQGDSPA